jgi:hypothetical protein
VPAGDRMRAAAQPPGRVVARGRPTLPKGEPSRLVQEGSDDAQAGALMGLSVSGHCPPSAACLPAAGAVTLPRADGRPGRVARSRRSRSRVAVGDLRTLVRHQRPVLGEPADPGPPRGPLHRTSTRSPALARRRWHPRWDTPDAGAVREDHGGAHGPSVVARRHHEVSHKPPTAVRRGAASLLRFRNETVRRVCYHAAYPPCMTGRGAVGQVILGACPPPGSPAC